MDNFKNINDDNIGGIRILQFAPRYQFSNLQPDNLEFIPGYSWNKIEHTFETASLDQDSTQDDAGALINITINLMLPKHRNEIDKLLRKYINQACIIKLTDFNGNTLITGMFPGELILQESTGSGAATTDLNGYKITFKGTQTQKAYFLNT